MRVKNIKDFAGGTAKDGAEFFETLASGESAFRVERIVSHGAASPEGFWYDQNEDEFITVLSGSAHLRFDDCCVDLSAGDWLVIKRHVRHRVESTSQNPPCVWLAVFGLFDGTYAT